MSRFFGVLLLCISLFMVVGFIGSGASLSQPAAVVAALLVIALPAGAGIALLRSRRAGGGRLPQGREELRRRTIDAEVLRLAGQRGGRLTVIELMSELTLTADEAKAVLEAFMRRDQADIEVTESGVLVYRFPDVQRLPEKDRAKGVLDA